MKSIMMTYPDFRTLPRGLKQMLLVSEDLFFEEGTPAPVANQQPKPAAVIFSISNNQLRHASFAQPSWRN